MMMGKLQNAPLNFNCFTFVVPAHLPLSSLPLFLQHYV